MPLADYAWSMPTNGTIVYNHHDTITTGTGNCPYNCSNYYTVISRIDSNGNILQNFTADLGTINQNVYGGGDAIRSGAKDWRGNVYLGGSITNYMHTPAGNVTNTDGASGNFFITKIGTSSCACPTPGVSFTVSTSGDTLRLSATTTSQHDSIIWHYGDGTSGKGDTLRHTYAHDGTYTVTAIAYNACGRDSLVRQVTVSGGCAAPQISFTYLLSGDTLRLSPVVTGSYDSIVWVFDDGTTAMADTVQHIYQHDDTYLVSAIVYNSCGHSSTAQAITVTTAGIGEVARYRTFLYPNPTGDKINVQVAAPATLGLLSASGTMLWSAPHELSQAGTYVFDLSSYAAGIYYCVVAYTAGQTEVLSVSKR
ncbi:MAG: PKD domain-containing protein [Bacteroidetes bacterium]|nr:PKD domain-containing protein [Bacteroidota bacterium]